MSKVVKLSDFNGKAEDVYNGFMTQFWEFHDLYWELSNGGFFLWSVYVDAGNTIKKSELKTLAAAANLLIIELNKDRILEEGIVEFTDHMTLLSTFYQIDPSEITSMSVKLKVSMAKLSLDYSEMVWDDEVEESSLYDEDDYEFSPEMLNSKADLINQKYNFHVIINFDDSSITKEQLGQAVMDFLINARSEEPIKFYPLCINDADLSFSIDCQISFMILFRDIMEEEHKVIPDFVVIRNIDENAFIPNDHYSSFLGTYRDMVMPDLEDEEQLNKFIEKFNATTPEERRKLNANAREDDDFAAIALYGLPQEEGITKAKAMLNTNPHNIEAQILIAGWEGDLERRIDLLTVATDLRNLDYDYKQISKDKMWWGASHTRPFMRAKFLLAKNYEFGGYIDDAIEGYKEIIAMNPNDNQGSRFDLIKILYKIGDTKELAFLVNKFPNETDEYFSFADVYLAFMKYGKSSKTEKKIKLSIQANYYLACAIAKVDSDHFKDILDVSDAEDESLFSIYDKCCDDILPLFKNAELLKYYRKVIKEIIDRLNN